MKHGFSALLTPLPDGLNWRLMHDFIDYTGMVVKKGFVTDLASTPRLIWNIFPPFGKYTDDAISHDWRYRNHIGTRKEADNIFLEGMRQSGVSWIARQTIYWNVRAFGWVAWNNEERIMRAKSD